MKDVVAQKPDEVAHGDVLERQNCAMRGKHTKTGCVILAAGNSSRFGVNKLLASVRGKRLIEIILDRIQELPFGLTVAVTQYPEVVQLCHKRGIGYVLNSEPEKGISHSIRLGIRALQNSRQILFVLADQPNLRTDTLMRILEAGDDKHVVCAYAGGEIQNPMLFPRYLFGELEKLKGDCGAKQLALVSPVKTVLVDEFELKDLDQPSDLIYFE